VLVSSCAAKLCTYVVVGVNWCLVRNSHCRCSDVLCSFIHSRSDPCFMLVCRIVNDPAKKNEKLRSKLEENQKIGTTRLNEVLNRVLRLTKFSRLSNLRSLSSVT